MSKKQTLETLAFKALENGGATTELLEGYEPNLLKYDWYFLYNALPSKYKPALWAGAVAKGRLETVSGTNNFRRNKENTR